MKKSNLYPNFKMDLKHAIKTISKITKKHRSKDNNDKKYKKYCLIHASQPHINYSC
jgi:hypothetical protein